MLVTILLSMTPRFFKFCLEIWRIWTARD